MIMFSKVQYRNLYDDFDPDMNICDLPFRFTNDLANTLDAGPETCNWRTFLSVTETQFSQYRFSHQEVEERFGNRLYQPNGSPSAAVINALGALGMTVEELVVILDKLKMEKILMFIKKYEKIRILQHPVATIEVSQGDEIRMEVEASGFPYPRYQWFKFSPCTNEYEEIGGANQSLLTIENSSSDDSGTYCCRLHNGQGESKVDFSDEAVVIVQNQSAANHGNQVMKEEIKYRNSTEFYRQHADIHPDKARLPFILEDPKSIQIIVGQTIVLNCAAVGQPPLVYEWRRDGQIFGQSQESFIKIPGALQSHSGAYMCIVKNNFGEARSAEAIVTISDSVPQVLPQIEIEIISNPKTCTVEYGGNCVFSCDAQCRGEELQYKWFKDGKELPGENKSEMNLYRLQDMDKQGVYQCLVIAPCSKVSQLSNPASLSIKYDANRPPEFNPADKVALLIGNYEYRNESPLKAPKADVLLMSELFRSLDFKVVSLLNLTKTEMLSAVDEFSKLLGKGVYGVFYFCGHGFEEDGRCYLVPPDARAGYTIEDCVCADAVLCHMSKPEPALKVLILDICRIRNRVESKKPQILDMPHTGNTVFCYATSQGMYAYEDSENGILVKYLQKFILQPKGPVEIFQLLQEAVGKEPKHYKLQIPELRSNLLEPRRSLADSISSKGQTRVYERRNLQWHRSHKKPDRQQVKIEKLGMVVDMEFQSEFSNVLHVFVTVKNLGITSESVAFICNWPSSVSVTEYTRVISRSPMRTKTTIQDIQKLTEDLYVSIKVQYKLPDSQEGRQHTVSQICLGQPLVSVLKLWKPRTSEATEHEDVS